MVISFRTRVYKALITNLLLLLCLHTTVNAQFASIFAEYEDTLKILGPQILNGKDDFVRYSANEKFLDILEEVLQIDGSFNYPFDSLNTIARLVSPDKKFRIFNWNIPKTDGTYEHFGIIQSYNKRRKRYDLYVLTDKSDEIENPELQVLNEDKWYGAHYYKIILSKSGKKTFYTLLGWDGNNMFSTKKIIEVLSFRSNGSPVFGYYLFKDYKKRCKRVIFEYSTSVVMSLRYETQQYDVIKERKKKKRRRRGKGKKRKPKPKKKDKIKKVKTKMIVFDHLVPMNPSFEGQYQYYVPVTNQVDAFIFSKGKWVYMVDIDARNPESPEFIRPSERPAQKDFYTPKKRNEQ